ncbi:unnamed protein product [Calypogeia fissa]
MAGGLPHGVTQSVSRFTDLDRLPIELLAEVYRRGATDCPINGPEAKYGMDASVLVVPRLEDRVLYFSLPWVMDEFLAFGISPVEIVHSFSQARLIDTCKMHVCHHNGLPRVLHQFTPAEMDRVLEVHSLATTAGVEWIVEQCCPQVEDFRSDFLDSGFSICDGAYLRDGTICPCCSGDHLFSIDGRPFSGPPLYDIHFTFHEDESRMFHMTDEMRAALRAGRSLEYAYSLSPYRQY